MITVERWTTADLARFPDDDALRYEIIDGELHVTKAPDTYHQIVAGLVRTKHPERIGMGAMQDCVDLRRVERMNGERTHGVSDAA